jgi:hypothetical protein
MPFNKMFIWYFPCNGSASNIESNSRGNNCTTHIYGQCSQEEIDDCIKKTIENTTKYNVKDVHSSPEICLHYQESNSLCFRVLT